MAGSEGLSARRNYGHERVSDDPCSILRCHVCGNGIRIRIHGDAESMTSVHDTIFHCDECFHKQTQIRSNSTMPQQRIPSAAASSSAPHGNDSRLSALASTEFPCQGCQQTRITIVDVKDGNRYCEDCWSAYFRTEFTISNPGLSGEAPSSDGPHPAGIKPREGFSGMESQVQGGIAEEHKKEVRNGILKEEVKTHVRSGSFGEAPLPDHAFRPNAGGASGGSSGVFDPPFGLSLSGPARSARSRISGAPPPRPEMMASPRAAYWPSFGLSSGRNENNKVGRDGSLNGASPSHVHVRHGVDANAAKHREEWYSGGEPLSPLLHPQKKVPTSPIVEKAHHCGQDIGPRFQPSDNPRSEVASFGLSPPRPPVRGYQNHDVNANRNVEATPSPPPVQQESFQARYNVNHEAGHEFRNPSECDGQGFGNEGDSSSTERDCTPSSTHRDNESLVVSSPSSESGSIADRLGFEGGYFFPGGFVLTEEKYKACKAESRARKIEDQRVGTMHPVYPCIRLYKQSCPTPQGNLNGDQTQSIETNSFEDKPFPDTEEERTLSAIFGDLDPFYIRKALYESKNDVQVSAQNLFFARDLHMQMQSSNPVVSEDPADDQHRPKAPSYPSYGDVLRKAEERDQAEEMQQRREAAALRAKRATSKSSRLGYDDIGEEVIHCASATATDQNHQPNVAQGARVDHQSEELEKLAEALENLGNPSDILYDSSSGRNGIKREKNQNGIRSPGMHVEAKKHSMRQKKSTAAACRVKQKIRECSMGSKDKRKLDQLMSDNPVPQLQNDSLLPQRLVEYLMEYGDDMIWDLVESEFSRRLMELIVLNANAGREEGDATTVSNLLLAMHHLRASAKFRLQDIIDKCAQKGTLGPGPVAWVLLALGEQKEILNFSAKHYPRSSSRMEAKYFHAVNNYYNGEDLSESIRVLESICSDCNVRDEDGNKVSGHQNASHHSAVIYLRFLVKINAKRKRAADLYCEKDYSGAIRIWKTLIGLDPLNRSLDAKLHCNLAVALLKDGKPKIAIEHCNEILRSDKENVKALFRRYQCQMKLKEYELAKADISTALKYDPGNPKLHEALGLIRKASKNPTHYEVLGLSIDVTKEEVKAAYYKLARRFHPDRHPNASEEKKKGHERSVSTDF